MDNGRLSEWFSIVWIFTIFLIDNNVTSKFTTPYHPTTLQTDGKIHLDNAEFFTEKMFIDPRNKGLLLSEALREFLI